jgi:hypothetical protein
MQFIDAARKLPMGYCRFSNFNKSPNYKDAHLNGQPGI